MRQALNKTIAIWRVFAKSGHFFWELIRLDAREEDKQRHSSLRPEKFSRERDVHRLLHRLSKISESWECFRMLCRQRAMPIDVRHLK